LAKPKVVFNKTSLSEDVYKTLKDKIRTGQLSPGQRILLRDFADELGVSITPVQYALGRLEIEGLVKSLPRRGFIVAELTLKDISELLDVRIMIETYAAGVLFKDPPLENLKARLKELTSLMESHVRGQGDPEFERFLEADVDFHRTLVSASNNMKLLDIYDQVSVQMQTIRFFFLSSIRSRLASPTVQEHQMIVEGVVEWSVNKTTKGIIQHLQNSKRILLEEAQNNISAR
jgi:DNA-binding GntR family transcriptional regulator